jgi:hypothetical protein
LRKNASSDLASVFEEKPRQIPGRVGEVVRQLVGHFLLQRRPVCVSRIADGMEYQLPRSRYLLLRGRPVVRI